MILSNYGKICNDKCSTTIDIGVDEKHFDTEIYALVMYVNGNCEKWGVYYYIYRCSSAFAATEWLCWVSVKIKSYFHTANLCLQSEKIMDFLT